MAGDVLMRRWMAAVMMIAASLAAANALAASRVVDAADARKAVQEGDWPRAIADWRELYVKGDREAAAQLCSLYFDARDGEFDAARVVDWCRRAAADGDAWARVRMGMLYLAGTGVARDADQAQVLCAAAASLGKPDVPAGFCLAAVAVENERAAQGALQPPQPQTRAAAISGPAATPGETCRQLFAAATFDAAITAEACKKAAAGDDAEALHRLGLMELVGLAGPRDLDAAERDCGRAQANSNGQVSTAFCTKAAAELRRAAAGLAFSRHIGAIDVYPATGLALPRTETDPYAADRLLDAPHTTSTGLAYTCRRISLWAVYEAPGLAVLTPRDTLFGRLIVDYQPPDFAALDAAAVACAKAVAAVDPRGSLTPTFAAFRRSLDALKTRRAALVRVQQQRRQDADLIAQVDRNARSGSFIASSNVSAQEGACIDRLKQAWRASGQEARRRSLEVRDTRLVSESGRVVAYGRADILNLDAGQRNVIGASTFSCAFDQNGGSRIAAFELRPNFAALR
jgi:TPR repeat protein